MSSNSPARLYPVLALLLGASMWGVIWYPMRRLEAAGLAGLWLTLVLYASALLASLPRTGLRVAEFRARPALMALLMLAAGWTNIAFVEAVLEGNILRVLLLFYLSPLWATLMGRLWLKERIAPPALASLALAMAGALIMLWDPALGAPWPQGRAEWMGISAGFAYALSTVVTRKVADVSVAAKSLAVWIGVVALAAVLIPALELPAPRAAAPAYLGAIALGLGGILVMTLLVQYGVSHLPVHRSAVIVLIELVAAALSQQLLTDEVVRAREWAGGALIVIGAYLAARVAGDGQTDSGMERKGRGDAEGAEEKRAK